MILNNKGSIVNLNKLTPLREGEKDADRVPFQKYFNKNDLSLVYNYEWDENKRDAMDDKNVFIIDFLSHDPRISVNGMAHANTVDAIFNLEISNIKTNSDVKVLKDKGVVYNRINNMPLSEKRDVSFYFGQNPQQKTNEELLMFLADFNSGMLMSDPKLSEFIDVWGRPENPLTEMKVIINKALTLEVISTQMKEGRASYYLGQNFLGVSMEDLLSYCTREEAIYKEHIRRETVKRDILTEADAKVEVKSAKFKETITAPEKSESKVPTPKAVVDETQTDEFKELMKEAKELKIQGVHLIKDPNKLRAKVEKARAVEA
jgi:hypothetical protein